MHTFEHTVEVAAPVEQVFEFGIDPENWERTVPGLTDVEVVEESEDGLRATGTYRMLGISQDTEMEMTIVEPGAEIVTDFDSGGMVGELRYRFEEIEDGTRVTQSAEYEFGDSLLERIIEPVASRYNRRQFRNSLETSKELVEAEAEAPIEA